MRHLAKRKRHLDTRKRADDREIIGVAEMADTKDLAGELGEAGASEMSKCASAVSRMLSALWPSGMSTAVSDEE